MSEVWAEPGKYLTEIHNALGCHGAYMVEEIERLKDREGELGQQVTMLEQDITQLRAALAAVQQRAETAERERDEARAQLAQADALADDKHCPLCTWRGPVELVDGVCPQCDRNWMKIYSEYGDALSEAVKRITELESATLTPRRCLTCARDAALDMRETAASFADNFDGDDLGFDLPTSIGSGIRVLPLPAECADCNPLEPEAENEATR